MKTSPSKALRWLFIAAVLPLLGACNFQDVEVRQVRKVEINRLDRKGVEFTATIHVVNPNAHWIKVTSTDAEIHLEGRKAGDAKLSRPVVIPARFDGNVEARVEAEFDGDGVRLIPILAGAALKRRVHLRAEGNLRAKSMLLSKRFGFDYDDEISF